MVSVPTHAFQHVFSTHPRKSLVLQSPIRQVQQVCNGECLVGPPILSLSRLIRPPKKAAAAPENMNTKNIPVEAPDPDYSGALTDPLISVLGYADSPLKDFKSTDIFLIYSILSFSAGSSLSILSFRHG